jgi:hypothetical protein
MNHISEQPRSNRLLIWLGGLLALLWAVTIATWMYDEAGYSFGMPMPVFVIHMLAPLLVGLIVGWRKAELWLGAKAGGLAGALFGAANIGVQLLWGGVLSLLGRISPDQPFTFIESIFEVLEFLVLFMIVGFLLGGIGGLLGTAIGRRIRGG